MAASRLLIVEDEAVVALDMSMQLRGMGYDIVGIAASGESAVAMVARGAPDLILMDVRLQGVLDGIETAAAIRRQRDVPVIFLTSHSDDETVQRAAATAPYGYLTKPYQLKELRAGIEVALTKARMERQLREADRWFAHTLQCVADAVVVTDKEARLRFMNPAAERLTGWAAEEAAGLALADVVQFTGEGQADAGVLVQTVLQRGRPVAPSHGVALRCRNGMQRMVDHSAGPVDDDAGQRLGAVLVLRDAAERMAQEARLRASEERFRNAFDHAPLGMALVSLAGDFIQFNDALCRLVGASPELLRSTGWRQLQSDADRGRESERLRELLGAAAGGVLQFETRLQRLDGGAPVWVLASVSLLHDGGRPSCHLVQLHDLSAQRAAAEQLAELAQERLGRQASELASKAKTEFLARVSHEMRTPLNAVIGFAQLLQLQQAGGAVDAPGKVGLYAQHIRAAGEHMLALVSDLLDLNRVAQGALKMQPRPLALRDAVAEALALLGTVAHTHGIALVAEVAPALRVLADPTRLRQVLLNLGSNAVKYNRQGGSVRFVAQALGGGMVQLRVEDTGIGMTPEQLQRLFQPFERLGAENTGIPGIGLGLAIARGLVVEMGGTLEVSSQPRAGSVVCLALPQAPPAGGDAAGPVTAA